MKRTVVDLSFSFFMTHKFLQPDDGLSLPKRNEEGGKTAARYLRGIALRQISKNIALQSKVMYKIPESRRAALPRQEQQPAH